MTTFKREVVRGKQSWVVEYGPFNVFEPGDDGDWAELVKAKRREFSYPIRQEPLRLTTIGFALGDISLFIFR